MFIINPIHMHVHNGRISLQWIISHMCIDILLWKKCAMDLPVTSHGTINYPCMCEFTEKLTRISMEEEP